MKIALMIALFAAVASVVATNSEAAERHLAHIVFFKLKDSNDASRKTLVEACNKYLSGHDGTVYYSAGVIAEELDREVNDRDFDVALHLVFDSKASHDKYQTHKRHLAFIEENKATWAKVRVFDSYVDAAKK